MHDIEKTIEHLKSKNIAVAAIYTKLGMERGLFGQQDKTRLSSTQITRFLNRSAAQETFFKSGDPS